MPTIDEVIEDLRTEEQVRPVIGRNFLAIAYLIRMVIEKLDDLIFETHATHHRRHGPNRSHPGHDLGPDQAMPAGDDDD